jgi:aspartyl-tRNA(Asn)/glutamyl-tRNA(Gln) amidotransferase subunit C
MSPPSSSGSPSDFPPGEKHQQLSADYVRKVARLSRLALSDAQVEDFQAKLSVVVTYVDRLRELDLTGIEPMANVGDNINRFDEDVPGPTIPNAVLMSMSHNPLSPFIRVPKVLDEGGGA